MSSTDSQDTRAHIPVMQTEVLDWLSIQSDGIYFDGTIGLGGHATAILARLSADGKLIGSDLDEEALAIAKSSLRASLPPVSLHHASYASLPAILAKDGINQVNGILLDLGLSSLQLDSPQRGFSYRSEGPLDMRFDTSRGIPASELIHNTSDTDLANLIYKYGEERRSRSIARSIKQTSAMETIADLTEAIRRSTPPNQRQRSLARVFQALRIAVNDELDQLESFLEKFKDYLTIGGRIVILSYHSLEDRLVKHTFKALAQSGVLKILTKRPLRPGEEEIIVNRRAKPAKLRAAERIA